MNIQGNSFVENIIITAALSEMKTESKSQHSLLNRIEVKIIKLLDAILATLSFAYREKKASITNKIMLLDSKKFDSVEQATTKIFPEKSKKKIEESIKVLPEIDKAPLKIEARVESIKKIIQEETDQPSVEEQKVSRLQEVEKQLEKTVQDLSKVFQEMDVEGLLEGKTEIEGKAKQFEENKNLVYLIEYLQQNPAALTAFSYLNEQISSTKFQESFAECFSELDVKGLAETNPKLEEIAEQYNVTKEMTEIRNYMNENPGALSAFLVFLQLQVEKASRKETK